MSRYLRSVVLATLCLSITTFVESYESNCEGGCRENEICIGPGICACSVGYQLIKTEGSNSECGPICADCFNGICVSPGVCECMEGFAKKDGVCQAYCWMDCTNGICIKENVCQCKRGFALSLPSLKCETVCEDCGRRACVGPNTCECQYGYAWSIEKKECLPTCTYCRPGLVCIAPEKCGCPPDYAFKPEVVPPTCIRVRFEVQYE